MAGGSKPEKKNALNHGQKKQIIQTNQQEKNAYRIELGLAALKVCGMFVVAEECSDSLQYCRKYID